MFCKCDIIEFDGDVIQKNLGRKWDLGPVVVKKDLGSTSLSIFVGKDTLEHSLVSLSEFKRAVMVDGDVSFMIKFALENSRGEYDFGDIEFDDQAACWYRETHFYIDKIELNFEMVAKRKELSIFNGVSSKSEPTGVQKPLFWASVLKRDIH